MYISQQKFPHLNSITDEGKEEARLLQRLAEGDKNAFWVLWQQHQKYLYLKCLNWMGNNQFEAEEALSLAMLKAWEKLPQYAVKITHFRSWLTSLTRNLCVDIHRERLRKKITIENMEEIILQEHEAVISEVNCPESVLLCNELRQFIHSSVNNLPDNLRIPFILRYYQQLSYPHIARKLGISQDQVYKRIQQARFYLKKRLTRYLSGLENPKLTISQSSEEQNNSVSKTILSDSSLPNDSECLFTVINYNLTAKCLQKLSHPWYQSPCLLGWR